MGSCWVGGGFIHSHTYLMPQTLPSTICSSSASVYTPTNHNQKGYTSSQNKVQPSQILKEIWHVGISLASQVSLETSFMQT